MIAIGTRRVDGGRDGRDYRYVGVLRDGRAIVAECGHDHANRDAAGDSATDCIRMVLRATARDAIRDGVADVYRQGWRHLGLRGFQQTTETIARAKADAEAKAAAFVVLVDEVAALLAARGLRVDLGGCFSATRIVAAPDLPNPERTS